VSLWVLWAGLAAACGREPGVRSSPERVARLEEGWKALARELDPAADGAEGLGRRAPDLAFVDLDGRAGKLSDAMDDKGLLVVIRDVGCPVSKRYGNETARIDREYSPRGVGVLYVNCSAHNSEEEMREEIETFGFRGRYAHDPEGRVGRALGATTTAEVFLFDASRTLVYRGAIDDQYGLGASLPAARHPYLRAALDALLAGEPPPVAATTAPGCYLDLGDAEQEAAVAEPVTYHREIARIVQRNCVECHRDGGVGPFALDSYDALVGRKGMVRYVLREGIMPPWYASEDSGPFRHERRLPAEDLTAILEWFEAGAPEGDPADGPVPRAWHDGWLIGEPDLVFAFPEPFPVPAEGVIDLQQVFSEIRVPRDVWVRRMQVLPSEPQVVHHATVTFMPPAGAQDPEKRLYLTLAPWTRARQGWQFLTAYLPGKGPQVFEDDVAFFLPRGSRIRFEMHYTPNGTAVQDRSLLGLVLADEPPEFVCQSRLIRNRDFVIPPGSHGVPWTIDKILPQDALLRALTPHMHLIGDTFDVELIQPDGERTKLLSIPEWNVDWQITYEFREPPLARAGSRIHVTATFDNRPENPNNQFPGRTVTDGPQIWDEMLILVVEWVFPREPL